MASVKRIIKTTGTTALRVLPSQARSPILKWYVGQKLHQQRASKTPSKLTYFVTNKCNARCPHCFYWAELNTKKRELTLDEIERIVRSLDRPVDLSLTGGEPTIRKDLVEICRTFIHGNGCSTIGIASNGSLPNRLLEWVDALLRENRLENLSVQVSLDGPEAIHDDIRKIPGGYVKAIECLETLNKLAETEKRLKVYTALAIQRYNLDYIEEFITEMYDRGISHRFLLIRGNSYGTYALPTEAAAGVDPMEADSAEIPLERLKEVTDRIRQVEEQRGFALWPIHDRMINEAAMQILSTQESVLPCYSGHVEAILYPDGEVALCELSRTVGNVRDYNLDMAALWSAPATNEMRGHTSKCYCIHSCALGTAMEYDAKSFDRVKFGASAS